MKLTFKYKCVGGKTKAFHVPVEKLEAFYLHAASGWHEASFLSEMATALHILFLDLDIYIPVDSAWTSEHAVIVVAFIATQVYLLLSIGFIIQRSNTNKIQ
jgi:hypothetical protein